MTSSANLGFPRIGAHRELKKAVEACWKGQMDHAVLLRIAADLRARHWTAQKDAGIDVIPSNDFSFYDQVLDMTAALGAVPARFGHGGGPVGLNTLFAMARGTDAAPAMEMTKWFDTNYHYIVPELHPGQRFALSTTKAVDEFTEAKALGKAKEADFDPLSLLESVLPVYVELLGRLAAAGAEWVQMDEPILALDLTPAQREALTRAYGLLSEVGPSLMLASYFGGLGDTTAVAILNWSFVRDDVPRSETCRQIALAIRDEVQDLEAAGIGIIQIDEPALREGLPLRTTDWDAYLAWAVESFRLASSGVADGTQIHTHMCYCEFNDIMPSIAALDADVISIETSRSDMELLDAFVGFHYPNEIGPGVWDIHSPRVPPVDDMRRLLEKASNVLPAENLWVNPDCGLKTRGWPEVKASLETLVTAARSLRQAEAA
ncbi:hypothetical protein F1188_19935 [Roseospira marina]|uniref:Cobalamin-independent methionine synthase MetE C-terminal/archaeal domain-containing protein n=1 Tax=Roseospira marina TaxID=140057 RepID=A0A5M6I4Z0_9PROT|nr:hypothetical protein [Roseospira marina]KAA5603252.1 hypothetical protein F1188_19935 [Roseospira marina]MBB4316188.1 methionine synthase II (cobalamin-independent) [Roseospira marina]MBB5089387.1 methionine synthase II (cobalamin-independent) [Roseospira marina]